MYCFSLQPPLSVSPGCMHMFRGPPCQEAKAVYLAVDAAYGPQKEDVNSSLDVSPSDLRALSAGARGVGEWGSGWAAVL